MKGTVLAVETGPVLRRAALLRGGVLDGIEVDRVGDTTPLPGAVYRCRITGLLSGIGAATADLGGGEKGFFPDAAGLIPGQSLLAEVRRAPEGDKAARLSPALQLHGEHMVFTPARPGINLSRRIADEAERARLRAAIAPLAPRGGFVIRTAARGMAEQVLHDEATALVARYDRLAADDAPGLRAPAPDAVSRLLGDAALPGSVMADEASLDALPRLHGARRDPAPFEALDIDPMIDALLDPRHDLGEGWLSIDPTPALVAIDVNTSNAASGNTRLRVNLDAARSIPRLLSLKKLGGLVLVDFAGAPRGDDRTRIAEAFDRAAARYLTGAKVFGWGPAGLLEAVSPRSGPSLAILLSKEPR